MKTIRKPTGAAVMRPDLTEAVIEAVLEELAARGVGRLSMQAVADNAGVGKSALYRRWASKHEMVMDVVARFGVADGPPLDTGSLLEDLVGLLTDVRDWLTHPRLAPVVVDLLAEARRSPDLAVAFRTQLAEPRRDACREVLRRARDREEVPALTTTETEIVVDIIASVPFWQLAIHGSEMTADEIRTLARMLVRAVTSVSGPAGRG